MGSLCEHQILASYQCECHQKHSTDFQVITTLEEASRLFDINQKTDILIAVSPKQSVQWSSNDSWKSLNIIVYVVGLENGLKHGLPTIYSVVDGKASATVDVDSGVP